MSIYIKIKLNETFHKPISVLCFELFSLTFNYLKFIYLKLIYL